MQKPHIPLNLKKLSFAEVVQQLQPGDPFTFIVDDLLKAEHPKDESLVFALREGDAFARRFQPHEHPRQFRITNVTQNKDDSLAYETRYEGFWPEEA